jgi:hypothetical protein
METTDDDAVVSERMVWGDISKIHISLECHDYSSSFPLLRPPNRQIDVSIQSLSVTC